jgi:hypothetical protein
LVGALVLLVALELVTQQVLAAVAAALEVAVVVTFWTEFLRPAMVVAVALEVVVFYPAQAALAERQVTTVETAVLLALRAATERLVVLTMWVLVAVAVGARRVVVQLTPQTLQVVVLVGPPSTKTAVPWLSLTPAFCTAPLWHKDYRHDP